MARKIPVADRLLARVLKIEGGCWLFRGAASNAYGHGRFDGTTAHRMAWTLWRGPIPTGMSVLHRCDVARCVNPDHLYLGTQADNIRDCVAKGRHKSNSLRGDASNFARLTSRKVRNIRDAHAAGISKSKLAKRYGVALGTIGAVVSRATWKHI